MKIKDGFVMREVAGQIVVIAVGEASKDFHGMIYLNSTGKCIWEGVRDGLSEKAIVGKLIQAYDVDSKKARQDVHAMILKMVEAGVIEQ